MRPVLFSITLGLTSALAIGSAQAASLVDRYYAALHMDEVFEILRNEGVEAGEALTEDGQITASRAWTARLNGIYNVDRMGAVFLEALEGTPDFEASEDAIAFFESKLGAQVARLEIDARIALVTDGMEEDMLARVNEMRRTDADRIALYEKFIEVNDLIDSNVSGALNANLAYYNGLASNKAFGEGLTEDFILTAVWGQEGEIRRDTQDWTISFSALAYSPLSEDELQRYIEISESASGQKLNAALFAGFDKMFEFQSYELGRATAEFSIGDDT